MVKATPYTTTLGFSDRLVRQMTGCSLDSIPRFELDKGTVLKTLLSSRSRTHVCYLVIADGSTLEANDSPTGDPKDYQIVVVPQG